MKDFNKYSKDDIENFTKIDPKVVATLRLLDIKTIPQLWKYIGELGVDNLIYQFGLKAEVDRESLLSFLTNPDIRKIEERKRPLEWRLVNTYRFLLLILCILFVLPVFFAWLTSLKNFSPGQIHQVVVAAAELPALHIIEPGDVAMQDGPEDIRSSTSISDVIGRYPLEAVAAGTTLHTDQLSKIRRDDLKGRRLISLPIRPGAIIGTLIPGDRISLVFAPREHCCEPILTPLAVNDVLVWQINRRDEAAAIVVAVEETGCAEAVASYLAVADVFMWQSASVADTVLTPMPCVPMPTLNPIEESTHTPTDTPSVPTAASTDTPGTTPGTTPIHTPTKTLTAPPTDTPIGTQTLSPTDTPTGTLTATSIGTPIGTTTGIVVLTSTSMLTPAPITPVETAPPSAPTTTTPAAPIDRGGGVDMKGQFIGIVGLGFIAIGLIFVVVSRVRQIH